ncbi:MAG TPA: hypothetical protein VGS03_01315 [Candidatus Polarisedimenticolia bacterium]|nr:hypothetical protein [Candidatus Polarisedimenticolia bacterium]
MVRLIPLTRALILSLAFLFFFSLETALAWQVTFQAFSTSSAVRGLAIDAERNIITAASFSNRFLVTKLSGSTGEVLWSTTIGGTGIVSGTGIAVAVDTDGSVVAGGNLTIGAPGFFRTQFTVVKLDGATGAEQWRYVINSLDGYASEVGFDSHGDVVAAGTVRSTSYAFFVVKLSGLDGSELWRRSDSGLGGTSGVLSLALDPSGDVIAGGYFANSSSNTGLLVEKLSGATGGLAWVYRIDTAGTFISNAANSVAANPQGDVFAVGRVAAGSTWDAFAVKLSGASGGELWKKTIDGGVGDYDTLESVALDGSGDAVFGGSFGLGPAGTEFSVVKVEGDSGTEKWRHATRGSLANSTDRGFAVAVAGNAVVALGRTENTGKAHDWTTVKLNGATGEELWRTDVSGTASNSEDDFAFSLGVDACADVVVAGQTQNTANTSDYTVLKLSGATGLSKDTFSEGQCDESPSGTPPHDTFATQAVVECTGPSGGVVTLDGSASTDDDSTPGTNDDIQRFEWFEDYGQATQRSLGEGVQLEVTLGLGAHVIGLQVTDSAGLGDVAEQTVTVQDTTPPTLTLTLSPTILSPPNHQLVRVQAVWQAVDVCDPDATVKLVSATSSEPDDAPGAGDGTTTGDIEDAAIGTPDVSVLLRAERAAAGTGRVYTLEYTATDASGNPASSSVQVTVPHDQGRSWDAPARRGRALQGTTRNKPAVPVTEPLPLP